MDLGASRPAGAFRLRTGVLRREESLLAGSGAVAGEKARLRAWGRGACAHWSRCARRVVERGIRSSKGSPPAGQQNTSGERVCHLVYRVASFATARCGWPARSISSSPARTACERRCIDRSEHHWSLGSQGAFTAWRRMRTCGRSRRPSRPRSWWGRRRCRGPRQRPQTRQKPPSRDVTPAVTPALATLVRPPLGARSALAASSP